MGILGKPDGKWNGGGLTFALPLPVFALAFTANNVPARHNAAVTPATFRNRFISFPFLSPLDGADVLVELAYYRPDVIIATNDNRVKSVLPRRIRVDAQSQNNMLSLLARL